MQRKWKRNRPSIDYAEAARLYQSGLSTVQVAARLGVTSPTICRALRLRGVERRSISDSVSLRSLGERKVNQRGYISVNLGKYKRKLEHRIVAEKALGRQLKRNEHVHHINCNPADNRNENLLICTREYHLELHWRMSQHPHWRELQKRQGK